MTLNAIDPAAARRGDAARAAGRDDRDAHDGAAQEGPAQRLDSRRAAARRTPARASRRPRLHAALRSGARRPGDAGIVGVADLDPGRDRGDAGRRDRRRRRDGHERRRHLRRHPVRADAEARRRRARQRWRRSRPRRRSRHRPAGLVPGRRGAGVGERPDLRRLAGADRLRRRRRDAERRRRRRRRWRGRHSGGARRRRRRRRGRAGTARGLDHARGRVAACRCPGLYPANDATKARYDAWVAGAGEDDA